MNPQANESSCIVFSKEERQIFIPGPLPFARTPHATFEANLGIEKCRLLNTYTTWLAWSRASRSTPHPLGLPQAEVHHTRLVSRKQKCTTPAWSPARRRTPSRVCTNILFASRPQMLPRAGGPITREHPIIVGRCHPWPEQLNVASASRGQRGFCDACSPRNRFHQPGRYVCRMGPSKAADYWHH